MKINSKLKKMKEFMQFIVNYRDTDAFIEFYTKPKLNGEEPIWIDKSLRIAEHKNVVTNLTFYVLDQDNNVIYRPITFRGELIKELYSKICEIESVTVHSEIKE
jgi:hypothetical protein